MYKLITEDDPILHEVSTNVGATDADRMEMEILLDFMWMTLEECPTGIGLAANQVGATKRVFIMNCNGVKQEFINPVITKESKNGILHEEQCLSCPGLTVKVLRKKQITVVAQDQNLKTIKRKFRGLTAVVVQHEIDHLNGITLRDKLDG